MKHFLKKSIQNFIFTISSIYYKASSSGFREKGALVLVPSWEGSIGDEAVINSITTQLKEKGLRVTLIQFGTNKEWAYLQSIDAWHGIPNYFKTGGWKDHLKFIKLFSKNRYFFTLGTDMLDGCYAEWLATGILRITHQASSTGLETTIVGFSLNSWQNKNCITLLRGLPKEVRFCPRDIVTQNRLKNLMPERETILTADMAFLLKPTDNSETTKNIMGWIDTQKKENRLLIGININPQLFNDERRTVELIQVFAKSLGEIEAATKEKLAFLLIPHDLRPTNSDLTLLAQLYAKSSSLHSHFLFCTDRLRASEIKAVVGKLDVVITARMHLAIASLGQQTPIGCLVYQSKFEGLYHHFGLPDKYLLNPEKALDQKSLISFIQLILNDRKQIKELASSHWEDVKEKSLKNISIR